MAKNISFHNLQAFPEKEYGFVDLPLEQAQKIKKKLNGAILRGNKIVIEEARAPRIPSPDVEMAKKEKKIKEKGVDPVTQEKLSDSAKKESKKRKRNDETIKGEEVLDRQIKRGWTDPKAESKAAKREKRKKDGDKKERKKEREKSKYTTEPECLVRTTLPPNVALPAKGIEGVVVDKKAKRGKKDVVLHEFARTEKFATFLRPKGGPAKGKPAVEYIEGKGWVDEDGNVVEGEPPKPKHNEDLLKEIAKKNKVKNPKKVQSESESEDEEEDVEMKEPAPISDTSSSGSSSEDEEARGEESDEVDSSEDEAATEEPTKEDEPQAPESAAKQGYHSSSPSESEAEDANRHTTPPEQSSFLSISIPATATPPVNPLEAIYKRRKPDGNAPTVATESAFTFGLGGDDSDIEEDAEEDDTAHAMPMTPYTKQEFGHRRIRSGAPTPDTAHPARKQQNGWPGNYEYLDSGNAAEHEDEEGLEHYGTVSSPTKRLAEEVAGDKAEGEKKEETDPMQDFQKWFYENRGDANRAWKKRQKVAKKEVRQRENRRSVNNTS